MPPNEAFACTKNERCHQTHFKALHNGVLEALLATYQELRPFQSYTLDTLQGFCCLKPSRTSGHDRKTAPFLTHSMRHLRASPQLCEPSHSVWQLIFGRCHHKCSVSPIIHGESSPNVFLLHKLAAPVSLASARPDTMLSQLTYTPQAHTSCQSDLALRFVELPLRVL